MNEQKIFLPVREWLELGQVLNDRQRLAECKYFRAWHTQQIQLGSGIKIKADGKTYRAGRYCLEPSA